jgi:hypothetical protein
VEIENSAQQVLMQNIQIEQLPTVSRLAARITQPDRKGQQAARNEDNGDRCDMESPLTIQPRRAGRLYLRIVIADKRSKLSRTRLLHITSD